MHNFCPNCGHDNHGHSTTKGEVRKTARRAYKKKPRKLTAHNRFMSKELKRLKKKHPRMAQSSIFKKANAAWRRKRK